MHDELLKNQSERIKRLADIKKLPKELGPLLSELNELLSVFEMSVKFKDCELYMYSESDAVDFKTKSPVMLRLAIDRLFNGVIPS